MRAALMFGLLAAIAACSDSPGPAPGGAESETAPETVATAKSEGSKACEVLTLADAKVALGRDDVTNSNASGGAADLDICQFGYQGERLMDMGHVSVTIMPVDLASMRAGVEREKGTIEDVSGLGADAFYTPEFGLYVGQGSRTAVYVIGAGGMTDMKERSIALAKATISRL